MRARWIFGGVVAVGLVAGAVVLGTRKPPASAPAPTGRAAVKVFDDGRVAPDRWVVFHGADGSVLASTRTDAKGQASGPIGPGGMVTVVDATSMTKLVTFRDVEPGDEIVVGEPEDEGGVEATACRALVSLPAPYASTPIHVVSLGVGATEMADPKRALSLPVLNRFLIDGRFVVLSEALSAAREPVAFGFASATCPDGAPAAVTTEPWSTDYRPFTLHVDGEGIVTGELAIVRGEDRFERGRRQAPLRGGADLRFTSPRPLGADVRYRISVDHPGADERSVVVARRRSLAETTTVDSSLPRPSALAIDGSTPARPVVRWKVDRPSGDATLVRLWWPASHENEWTIVGPVETTSVQVPALPDELARFRPPSAVLGAVMLVDASHVDGYRDVRRRGLVELEDPPKDADSTLRYARVGSIDL